MANKLKPILARRKQIQISIDLSGKHLQSLPPSLFHSGLQVVRLNLRHNCLQEKRKHDVYAQVKKKKKNLNCSDKDGPAKRLSQHQGEPESLSDIYEIPPAIPARLECGNDDSCGNCAPASANSEPGPYCPPMDPVDGNPCSSQATEAKRNSRMPADGGNEATYEPLDRKPPKRQSSIADRPPMPLPPLQNDPLAIPGPSSAGPLRTGNETTPSHEPTSDADEIRRKPAVFPTGKYLNELVRLRQLRCLDLSDNELDIFPMTLINLITLVELKLAKNRLNSIPAEISRLKKLQVLILNENQLQSLPSEMCQLDYLHTLGVSHNQFVDVPDITPRLKSLLHIDLNNNCIAELPEDLFSSLQHIVSIKLAENQVNVLNFTDEPDLQYLQTITHLDVRDNNLEALDVKCLRQLEFLDCSYNKLMKLNLKNLELKTLLAGHNYISSITLEPQPENLQVLDLSHNKLKYFPEWICKLRKLEKLFLHYNQLASLPQRLLSKSLPALRRVELNHNHLRNLPEPTESFNVDALYLQHNRLLELPPSFLARANRLRILNLSKNHLTSLPDLNAFDDYNQIEELYLTANQLQDEMWDVINGYKNLKILHLAYNQLQICPESSIEPLEQLRELNLSANQIKSLPQALVHLPRLAILRIHSNKLLNIPDFSKAISLKVLDISFNSLKKISLETLVSPQLEILDISFNSNLYVDDDEFQHFCSSRRVKLIDVQCCNRRSIPADPNPIRSYKFDNSPWQLGFSETYGQYKRFHSMQLRMPDFGEKHNEALIGLLEGIVETKVQSKFPEIISQIFKEQKEVTQDFLRKSLLSIQRTMISSTDLNSVDNSIICHLAKTVEKEAAPDFQLKVDLQIANTGQTGAFVLRDGKPIIAAQPKIRENVNTVIKPQEFIRGRFRCSFPHSRRFSDPKMMTLNIDDSDELLIVGNHQVWRFLKPEEALAEAATSASATQAAKRLQDLIQSYGCREELSILILKFQNLTKTEAIAGASSSKALQNIQVGKVSPMLQNQCLKQTLDDVPNEPPVTASNLPTLPEENNAKTEIPEEILPNLNSTLSTKYLQNTKPPAEKHQDTTKPSSFQKVPLLTCDKDIPVISISALKSSLKSKSVFCETHLGNLSNKSSLTLSKTSSIDEEIGKYSSASSNFDEQCKSWEYILEKNTQFIFSRELQTLSINGIRKGKSAKYKTKRNHVFFGETLLRANNNDPVA